MEELIRVGMAKYHVIHNPGKLVCQGLGSCVAVVLYDKEKKIGGLAHVMLPYRKEAKDHSNPDKFADSAIDSMIEMMVSKGALERRIKAKIFGGANMFPHVQNASLMNMGEKNVTAVKRELAKRKIEIIAEDLRGDQGRTLVFDTRDGSVRVKTIKGEERVC